MVSYIDMAGHRRFKNFVRRKNAENWMARTVVEVQDGVHLSDREAPEVERVARAWLSHCEAEMKSGRLEYSTYINYRTRVNRHILDSGIGVGALKVTKLSKAEINAFRDRLLTSRSEALTRAIVTALSMMVEYACDNGWAVVNNARGVKIKRASRRKPKVNVPTMEEVRAVIEAADEPLRTILVVAAFVGLRASEIYGLAWEHVDFEQRVIHVRQRADAWGTIGETKSAAGERDIPTGPVVINTLRRHRWSSRNGGYVFANRYGRPLNHNNVRNRWFVPLLRDLDVKPFRFHDLRHFAVSCWIAQGYDPKAIMTFAGHSSIQITYDRYGHHFPSPEDDHGAMSAIENRVLGLAETRR
jgi:integrase